MLPHDSICGVGFITEFLRAKHVNFIIVTCCG